MQTVIHASIGNKEYSYRMLEELKNLSNQEGSLATMQLFIMVRDIDKMFEYLYKAYEERHAALEYLKSDSKFF